MSVSSATKCAVTILLLSILSGCIGLQTVPRIARSGDVVNFTLGGFKRNIDAQALVKGDLTVTLTDSNSVVHNPEVLGIYRAFPDNASEYAVNVQDRNDMDYGDLSSVGRRGLGQHRPAQRIWTAAARTRSGEACRFSHRS